MGRTKAEKRQTQRPHQTCEQTDEVATKVQINGCRQRFLTKFLKVRLVEVKQTVEERLEKLEAEAIEVEVKERRNTRILRQTERELIPLGKGTVEKVKLLRTARLRKKVRSERSGAGTIQRIFRGWRVRKAINSWYRDYWIESEDAATGDVYYVNTWNQEIRWVKPLEISLFEHSGSATSRPGTGNSSKLSFADDDDDGDDVGGVDSIGGRFRQRLVDLTKEAALAAEEEEKFLRYVAANAATLAGDTGARSLAMEDGADNDVRREKLALAAAIEWRFVRTDARFGVSSHGTDVQKKCWFHSMTSQYFWGDHPPLLGLLRVGDDLQQRGGKAIAGAGHLRSGGSADCDDGDGGGSTLARSDGWGCGNESTPTVHPKVGLIFADRASGEAWLKAQVLDLLLKQSEKVCDIGPTGWCQRKAAIPPPVPEAGGVREKRVASMCSTGLTKQAKYDPCADAIMSASEKGSIERQIGRGGGEIAESGQQGETGTDPSTAVVRTGRGSTIPASTVVEHGQALPLEGSFTPRPFFTFFHRAETGEVRWCLSPRSALVATPRTARRDATQARLLSQGNEQQQEWIQQGTAGDEGGFANTTASGDREALTLTTNDTDVSLGDGDGWEVVEDGDVIFYYNEKLGISTWEPPPGWDQGNDQETNGAGG